MGLSAPLLKAVADKGYTTPSPIQAQAIPAVIEGVEQLHRVAESRSDHRPYRPKKPKQTGPGHRYGRRSGESPWGRQYRGKKKIYSK